jgi:hypothetical protein
MTTRPCLLTRQLLLLLKKHRTVRGFYIELVRAAHLLKSTISLSRSHFRTAGLRDSMPISILQLLKTKKERNAKSAGRPITLTRNPFYPHASPKTHDTMQESNFSLGQTPLKCSRGKPPDSHSTPLCREQHAVALSERELVKKKHTHSKQNINYLGCETNFESSPSILWIQEER